MSKISLDKLTEEEIIKRCRKNKEAFGVLYEHYHKHILNFIKFKVDSVETAEDLTSVVFQKSFEGIDGFKWQGVSFSSWIYRIARNTVIDHYRSSNKYRLDTKLEDENTRSLQKTPEESAEYLDFEDQLKDLLKTLPDKERKIIYMKFMEGYTNKTIAKLLGFSETNVGTIIYRAIGKLRQTQELRE